MSGFGPSDLTALHGARREPSGPREIEQLVGAAKAALHMPLVAQALPLGPLPDARETFILRDFSGTPRAVAQLSSPAAPRAIARALDRATGVRQALAPMQAAAVIDALTQGEIDGATFAIWPHCDDASKHRMQWLARRGLTQPMLTWLREVARQTRQEVSSEQTRTRLLNALENMISDVRLTERTRESARNARTRLRAAGFPLLHVAMHGDLHIGNILIDAHGFTGRSELPWRERFALIDWYGGNVAGWPLYDLMRAASSLRISDGVLAREIGAHCTDLRFDLDAGAAHLVFALAMLGTELEYFPIAFYATMVDQVLERYAGAVRQSTIV